MGIKRKNVLAVVLTIVIIGGILGIRYLIEVSNYKNKVNNFQIGTLDLKDIKDGEYIGSCDVDFIQVKLRVKVQNHKIVQIDILQHKNGRGKPAEAIVNEVMDKQSLQVDTISGATNSSKVILKAIEDALNHDKKS